MGYGSTNKEADLKIAFVVSSFPKLSEKFVLDQITGLIDRHCDVHIFADNNPDESEVHSEFNKYNLAARTHYIPAPPKNKIKRVAKAISVVLISFLRNPYKTLTYILRTICGMEKTPLRQLCWCHDFFQKRFDVVHCHFGPNGNKALILKKLGICSKLIVTFHGYDVTAYLKSVNSNVYGKLFKLADKFTFNSEATKNILLGIGCPQNKMIKLPMGIELDRMQYSERKIGSDGVVKLLSVGRLVEMKGREYAIKGVAKLLDKHPEIQYYIVGDGPERSRLESLVTELNVAENIHLLGWVDTDKLEGFYSICHIFIHPSVTSSDGNMEGQGVVLVEAQACGMPIVATNHNAFSETVLDGQSGFLVPERDADALSYKIEYLIEHPESWLQMGRKGVEHAFRYDIEKLNDLLLGIYRH